MIEATGLYITYNGDPSVGIFSCEWTIAGPFQFDTEEDYKAYIDKLKESWEYCWDTPVWVETFEARQERIKNEWANYLTDYTNNEDNFPLKQEADKAFKARNDAYKTAEDPFEKYRGKGFNELTDSHEE